MNRFESTYEAWITNEKGEPDLLVAGNYATEAEARHFWPGADVPLETGVFVVIVEAMRRVLKPRVAFTREAGWVPTQSTGYPAGYWKTHYYAKDSKVSICQRKMNEYGQPDDKEWSGGRAPRCKVCLDKAKRMGVE